MNPFSLFSGKAAQDRSGEISYEDLTAALGSHSCALVDVREAGEFAAGHVPGAVNRPLSSFDPNELPKDKPVVLMCLAGGRPRRSRRPSPRDARTWFTIPAA